MLLLDRNNEPTSTVYYLAAVLYDYVSSNAGPDAGQLYETLTDELIKKNVSYDFFIMALDFLFLLDCMRVDEKGGLSVYQVAAN